MKNFALKILTIHKTPTTPVIIAPAKNAQKFGSSELFQLNASDAPEIMKTTSTPARNSFLNQIGFSVSFL